MTEKKEGTDISLIEATREFLNGYFYNNYFFSKRDVLVISSSIAVFTSGPGPEGISREFEVRIDEDKTSGMYDLLIVASVHRAHYPGQALPATVSQDFYQRDVQLDRRKEIS